MTDAETSVVHTGDCLDVLGEMPESSVHCVMTSPPYFGLRNYNHDDQFGLEDTLDEYIDHLVETGRALRRVLRDDGSWWLNLGDSYADDKNKMLVPHRVAIALQEDAWVVRNDVTWAKPNPMPSSVKDRLNTTAEQIFHLTPEPDYWYDLDAIREEYSEVSRNQINSDYSRNDTHKWGNSPGSHENGGMHDPNKNLSQMYHPSGKNPGDVFEVTTKPFPDAHFAVYPPELCEKPIKASCPPKVCVECGAPYEREVEREIPEDEGRSESAQYPESGTRSEKDAHRQLGGNYQEKLRNRTVNFKGWSQTCDCATDATEPGICLDPFAGAGTTLLKAKELGRRFVGIELNPEYADMARARVGLSPEDPSNVRDDDAQTGLEAYDD